MTCDEDEGQGPKRVEKGEKLRLVWMVGKQIGEYFIRLDLLKKMKRFVGC